MSAGCEWRKAGRPRKNPAVKKTDGYKRSELKVARSEKDGLRMLAGAVLKQWIEDGRPNDIPMEWVAVLKELL